jgi:subtilisin family serine protease
LRRPDILRNLAHCLLGLALAFAPPAFAAASLHPAVRRIDPNTGLSRRFLTERVGAEPVVNLFLNGTVSPEELRGYGIEVNTWTKAGMTARCPLSRLDALRMLPGVTSIHAATKCRLLLDRSAVDADVATVRRAVPPDFAGQSGVGVLVGAVDSGIDAKHADFRRPDGSTRLVSVWDQTATGTPPHGFTYGAEYGSAQIDARPSKVTDDFGHGTHVLGIAAGDGSATGHGQPGFTYVGMAPEADLCMVKTDLSASGIADGVNYIFQVAAARGEPAVVNLSLGTQEGSHDGTLDLDRILNAMTGPGRIIVAAAGNEGADHIHGRLGLASGPQTMTLSVPSYTPSTTANADYVIVSSWYSAADQVSFTLMTPNGAVLGPVAPGDSLVGQATSSGYIDIYNNTVSARGDHEIYFQIYDPSGSPPPAAGSWGVRFTPVSLGGSGIVDSYVEASSLGDGSVIASWNAGYVYGGVINSPGDADSVICVGAHVTKQCWPALDGATRCFNPAPELGSIALFSSQGPRRDGVQKPELTAPGMAVASSKTTTVLFPPDEVTSDGTHIVFSGTSMATPHVTGAVALLLSHRVHAQDTPSQVRAILEGAARSDAYTGAVPNAAWGYGKLDIGAALGPALTVAVLRPTAGRDVVFGTTDSVEARVTGGDADSVVVSLSRDGGATFTRRIGATGALASGQVAVLTYTADPALATYHARVRCVAYNQVMGNSAAFSDSVYLIQPLLQNALRVATPSPFKKSTTIHFDLLQPAHVIVRVFSVRGTLVRTLADAAYPAGRQSVDWNGRDEHGSTAATGVYFCEFRAGSLREVRRLALIR